MNFLNLRNTASVRGVLIFRWRCLLPRNQFSKVAAGRFCTRLLLDGGIELIYILDWVYGISNVAIFDLAHLNCINFHVYFIICYLQSITFYEFYNLPSAFDILYLFCIIFHLLWIIFHLHCIFSHFYFIYFILYALFNFQMYCKIFH